MEDVFFETTVLLTDRIAAVEAATDASRLHADKSEKLAHFGPAGMWRFAPDSEKKKSEAAVDAEHADIAGRALFDLQDAITEREDQVSAAIARAMQAPDAEHAWQQRTQQIGLTAAEMLQTRLLAEIVTGRIAGELKGQLPSVVLKVYTEALTDPTEPANAAAIRYIEKTFSGTWPGTEHKANDAEVMAVTALISTIKKTKEGRVPATAGPTLEALAKARRAVQRTLDNHKVKPVRTREPYRT